MYVCMYEYSYSDLTDNQFYPSAERIWLSIRLNKGGKYCDITLPILANNIIVSDEGHFDLGGYVNKQNCRICGTENPNAPKTSHCCCGFWSRDIIGSFFFENKKGEPVTVNGDRYRIERLNEFLFTKIEQEDIGNIWFQQDGAMCHTAEATLDVLRSVFEDRIISRRADVVWPPRS